MQGTPCSTEQTLCQGRMHLDRLGAPEICSCDTIRLIWLLYSLNMLAEHCLVCDRLPAVLFLLLLQPFWLCSALIQVLIDQIGRDATPDMAAE